MKPDICVVCGVKTGLCCCANCRCPECHPPAPTSKPLLFTVKCPRCGDKHSLPLRLFEKPITLVGIEFKSWAMCPTLCEPIIFTSGGATPEEALAKHSQAGSVFTIALPESEKS